MAEDPDMETVEAAALDAAEAWLKLIDDGEYAAGWEEASELMKNAVAQDALATSLKGVRPPLGKVVNRTVKNKQYTTELPGAPDGEYVVIQYETEFENKRSAIETITPKKDTDGTWRVSGYFIK